MTDSPWIGALGLIAVAVISFVGARMASRDTRKATTDVAAVVAQIDERKVGLDEFREVQARNEAALERADKAQARADERIKQLEEALMEERTAREQADQRAAAAEERAQAAELRAARLERRVDQLEQVLRDNDMTVPAPLPDPA